MLIYLITTESASGHSHDWGGEFFYNKEDAQERAQELEDICEGTGEKFSVVLAKLEEIPMVEGGIK